jgi:hypothetical protein
MRTSKASQENCGQPILGGGSMRKLVRTSSLLGLVAFLALGGTAVQGKGPPPPP